MTVASDLDQNIEAGRLAGSAGEPMSQMLQELTNHLMRSYADGSGMRNIGLECELPLVDAETMHAPSLGVAQSILRAFADDGFELIKDAQTEAVVRAQRQVQSRTYAPVCDVVELELGYPTIEVSTAPEPTIEDAVERMRRLLRPLADRAAEASCAVLGYGMQPFTPPSRALIPMRVQDESICGML